MKEKKVQELNFPFASAAFAENWQLWKSYKKEQFRFSYKGTISEQAALNHLKELSHGNEERAVKIIEQSISQGWQGLFEIKNGHNNGNYQTSGKPVRKTATEAAKEFINGGAKMP